MLRNNTFWRKHVSLKLLEDSLSYLLFSLMFSQGEVKSPYFLQVWGALVLVDVILATIQSRQPQLILHTNDKGDRFV